VTERETVERLLAYEEIRQLAYRYAYALDRRDLDALVALFVEDVRASATESGHAALKASFEASLAPLGTTILSVSNHVIDLAGDTATGAVYCSAEIEQGEHWLRQRICYEDRYRKTDAGWRFVRRNHLLFYSAPMGVDPRTLPLANWPASNVGMGSLPLGFSTFVDFTERHPH
jgi:ketosteroid isomerase-like protein